MYTYLMSGRFTILLENNAMALDTVIYTARATAIGGRSKGTARTADGELDVRLDTPIEMGGKGGGTNPEQMFAIGYASCFIGALQAIAKERKLQLPDHTAVHSEVSFGTRANGLKGYNLDIKMAVEIPGMNEAQTHALVEGAHEICPYSNATRGNVDVTFTVSPSK
jgi:lipoyl-dependent peroxiredoxin